MKKKNVKKGKSPRDRRVKQSGHSIFEYSKKGEEGNVGREEKKKDRAKNRRERKKKINRTRNTMGSSLQSEGSLRPFTRKPGKRDSDKLIERRRPSPQEIRDVMASSGSCAPWG